MSIIEVSSLSKVYEKYRKEPGLVGTLKSFFKRVPISVPAVTDVSFKIDEGEFVGFIGPNGAGKTTTLKMLSGILWPTRGTATVMGFLPWKRDPNFQRRFGLVMGQKNQLWWDLPAKDTFLLNKEIYQIADADFNHRIKELSGILQIEGLMDTQVRKLSLGERMKCELVNSLLHRPCILFLDEPTIGLDVISQKAIRDFLKTLNQKEGTTILLTSHAMADVEALCPRVLVINQGHLSYDGSLEALVGKIINFKEVKLLFSNPVSAGKLATFGEVVEINGTSAVLRVRRAQVKDMVKNMLDGLPIQDLAIEEPPIEDVIRQIFQSKI
ncbi:ATP-binding cassette domain-containing protein [Candidatus Uhrbacteria bacterium]|nr:ATP-binding cassette domain-containing protein [Candidatus Uhrbacteria bacterium]